MEIWTFATATHSSVSTTAVLRHATDAGGARQPRLEVVGLVVARTCRYARAVLHLAHVLLGDAAAVRGVVAAAVDEAARLVTVGRQRAGAGGGLALGRVRYAHRAAGRR